MNLTPTEQDKLKAIYDSFQQEATRHKLMQEANKEALDALVEELANGDKDEAKRIKKALNKGIRLVINDKFEEEQELNDDVEDVVNIIK